MEIDLQRIAAVRALKLSRYTFVLAAAKV